MRRENVHQVNTFNTVGRGLAMLMVFVLIIGLIPSGLFTVPVHADTQSVLGDESNYDSVVIPVRVDGEDYPTVELKPGVVSKTVKSVSVPGLPEGAEFVEAVLVDSATDSETEVKYIASINGKTYYALDEKADFATKLEEWQELVLVYGTRYWITVNKTGKGSYELNAHKQVDGEETRYYVWSNEDLRIQKIIPKHDEDYGIDSISYSSSIIQDSVAVENSSATIPASDIRGDITLNIDFTKVSKYYITDVSYSKGLGNGGIANDLGESSFTASSNTHAPDYFKTRKMPTAIDVSGDNSKTFYLYSNSNTGDSEQNIYELNMLRINGQEIDVTRADIDTSVTTTVNGMEVTITRLYDDRGLYWLDNKPNAQFSSGHDRDAKWNRSGNQWTATGGWNKKRTIYQIDVSDVHSDIAVEYNFKKKNNREIIIKGLRGITATAHAREKVGNGTVSTLGFPTFEYYFESQESNVYTAYYYGSTLGLIPSANLYLYQVEKGYNPYTVSSDLYYVDGSTVEHKDRAQLVDDDSVYINLPDVAIYNANAGIESNNMSNSEKFNARFRKWGGNADQKSREDLYNDDNYYDGSDFFQTITSGTPYLLTYIGEHQNDSTWYAIALAQNNAKNQQLYLNAHPYQFKIELDLDGGELSDDQFTWDDDRQLLVENDAHSIEDPVTFLPDNDPSRSDKIFGGWQLQKWNGTQYVDYFDDNDKDKFFIYQKMDEIAVDDDLFLSLVHGEEDDQRIRFRAIWDDAETATKTKVRVEIYTQVPDGTANAVVRGEKSYLLSYENEDTQTAGDIVLLNKHAPENADYYTTRFGSYTEGETEYSFTKLTSTSIPLEDAAVIPEDNILRVYYDYRTVDLALKKVVKGKMRTSAFDITLQLTKDAISEITPTQVKAILGESAVVDGNSVVYTKTFGKGEEVTFSGIPYGWSYHVEETTLPQGDEFTTSYAPDQSGAITGNTSISVINTGKNPGIETDKHLTPSGDGYTLTLDAYATGESYVEDYKDSVPIDFAIVVDQSSAMQETIGKRYMPVKKQWTVSAATGSTKYYYQDPEDKGFYEVYSKQGTMYEKYSDKQNLNSTLLNSWTEWSLDWWCRTNGGNFYVYDQADDEFYYLYFLESGFESIGSYHVKFFYVRDTRINHSNASSYKATAKGYYDAGSDKVRAVTVGGKLEESYGRWVITGGLYEVNSNRKYLDVPVYTKTTGANSLWYKDANNVEHQIGTAKTASSTAYYGTLYTEKELKKYEALRETITDFVQEIADNAAASGVDHRVSLIGYAGNEEAKYATSDKAIGSNKSFDYINTGLFVNGQFKDYKKVDTSKFTSSNIVHGSNGNIPKNVHYYIKKSDAGNLNGYVPVYWDGSKWRTLTSTTAITPAYINSNNRLVCYGTHSYGTSEEFSIDDSFEDGGTRYGALYYHLADNVYRFYEVSYTDITAQNYQDSLVSANTSETEIGKVNSILTTEINKITAEGDAYASYGIAMANSVFNYATDESEDRKKVIVVFSCGVPGDGTNASTTVVGNEALADAYLSKNEYGADVYTIYLADNEVEAAKSFMANLSSENNNTMSAIYNADLEPTTYYYRDYSAPTEKTYAVTTSESSKSWIYYGNGGTGHLADISGYSNQNYYEINDNGEVSSISTRYAQLDVGKRYRFYNNGTKSMYYGYQWFDTDNYSIVPKASESDSDGHQFYVLGESQSTGKTGFAKTAKTANDLSDVFEAITNSLDMNVTIVTLNSDNSYFRDVITPEFELPYKDDGSIDTDKIIVQAVPRVKNGDAYEWGTPELIPFTEDTLVITTNPDGTKTVDFKDFDYGENYVLDGAEAARGKKLQIIINGITIPEGIVGEDLCSNVVMDSGIYKMDENGDTMVADFPEPELVTIEPLKAYVKLSFDGDTAQKFPVTFKLTKSDGETGYQGQYGDFIFDADGEFTTSMGKDDSKLFTDIPPNAKLTVTVSDPGNAGIYYTYTLRDTDNNEDITLQNPVYYEPNPDDPEDLIELTDSTKRFGIADITTEESEGGEIEQDQDITRELEISIHDNRKAWTITNYTVGENGDNSYADRNREFPIQLTLKDGNSVVSKTLLDINGREVTFDENGHYTVYLKNDETRGVYVPEGYTIIAEDAESPAPYNTVFSSESSVVDIPLAKDKATATLTEDAAVTVTHSIATPVPTSVSGGNGLNLGQLLFVILVMIGATGAFLWMNNRRKRHDKE